MLSSTKSYDNKYFIRYDDFNDGIIPLFVRLPLMNAFAKYFEDSKYMNLFVFVKKLLKKYNVIWNKINSLFKKEFDSEPVYNINT